MALRKALITGVSGQDGSYLARLLLSKGYEVHGTSRSPGQERLANLKSLGILGNVRLHRLNTDQFDAVSCLVKSIRPTEVYHLAGQSSVGLSFQDPAHTMQCIFQGTVNLLEALRVHHSTARFYQSASSEMFGGDLDRPYTESDAFHLRSPYAVGKAASYWAAKNYRESYGLFACSGILFNHESPLRAESFVTRKITSAVARIKVGLTNKLCLGDLSIRRDWGYAPEYVEAMWLMLEQPLPDDYVIATGQAHSLQEFVEQAFAEVGLDWKEHTVSDPSLFRPNEVRCSVGNPTKAQRKLGWQVKTGCKELIAIMVRHDLNLLRRAGSIGENRPLAPGSREPAVSELSSRRKNASASSESDHS